MLILGCFGKEMKKEKEENWRYEGLRRGGGGVATAHFDPLATIETGSLPTCVATRSPLS